MHVIKARNVHQALPEALYQIKTHGVKMDSRNGPVLKFPGPCTIVYEKPCERVMFWPERDCNPFFHLLESLWMLAGRNDVAFLSNLVSRMSTFSDDGETFNGAYGYRWRRHFKSPDGHVIDQMLTVASALKDNPDCRRQLITMWDAGHDLGLQSKDLPCNTHAYFNVVDGALNMMVCNRSNDLVWGALGANAVHFSVLQEFMAALIGCKAGKYWQMSMNMHLYLDHHEELMETMASYSSTPVSRTPCPYELGQVEATPLIHDMEPLAWLKEMQLFLDKGVVLGMKDRFLRGVAHPMAQAYSTYKTEGPPMKFKGAYQSLINCCGSDWRIACNEWVERRETKYNTSLAGKGRPEE